MNNRLWDYWSDLLFKVFCVMIGLLVIHMLIFGMSVWLMVHTVSIFILGGVHSFARQRASSSERGDQ